MRYRLQRFLFLCVFLCVLPFSCSGESALSRMNPLTPPDTLSPRDTFESFIQNMNMAYVFLMEAHDINMATPGLFSTSPEASRMAAEADAAFQRAMACIDLSEVPKVYLKDVGHESALLLKGILDRIPLPSPEQIPGKAEIIHRKESGNPLLSWTVPDTELDMDFMESGPREGEYLFAKHLLPQLKGYYQKVKHLPHINQTSEGFYTFYISSPGRLLPPKWAQLFPAWSLRMLWEQTLWQWSFLGISLGIFTLYVWLLYRFCFGGKKKRKSLTQAWINLLFPLGILLGCFGTAHLINEVINITGHLLMILLTALSVVQWLTASWGVILIGTLVAEIIVASPHIDPRSIDASLVRSVTRLTSIFFALLVFLQGGTVLGISLIPMLTGLGVAGLAISLAARPTIENIIGGILLFADRSVRVGETCTFGDTVGTVQHIGLRTTRIRGLDRTVISVPNADLSQMKIINMTRRDRIRMKTVLGLRYETSHDQLQWVLVKLRKMLQEHPDVHKEGMRVRMVGFGASSLDVELQAFITTRNWDTFLEKQEELSLKIMDIVNASGTGFAFPSQTTYIAKDTGLEEELSRRAEEEAASWGEMQEKTSSGEASAP